MPSYYSNYTTCINCNDLVAIKQAAIKLLEKEGGSRIDKLPGSADEISTQKPWIVGIFPALQGWTIIKTWSVELLCSKTIDDSRLRLSALAMELKCDAFYLSVYGGTYGNSGILLEAESSGKIHVAGCCNVDIDIEIFYEQPINKPDLIEDFSLLQVPESFRSAVKINQHPEVIEKEQKCNCLSSEKNPDRKLLYELEKEALKGHTQRIDEALSAIIDGSGIWAYPNLAYAIYECSEELSAAKGDLIYFQPPDNYETPAAYTLTPEPGCLTQVP